MLAHIQDSLMLPADLSYRDRNLMFAVDDEVAAMKSCEKRAKIVGSSVAAVSGEMERLAGFVFGPVSV